MGMRWKPALTAFAVTLADRWPTPETFLMNNAGNTVSGIVPTCSSIGSPLGERCAAVTSAVSEVPLVGAAPGHTRRGLFEVQESDELSSTSEAF
jgi:hypothetical protein